MQVRQTESAPLGVIWKFELRPWSIFIDVPQGATLLAVGAQGAGVVAWFRCDPESPKMARHVAAYPTGVPLPKACADAEYVGTVQMQDGLVFHVFDGGEVV